MSANSAFHIAVLPGDGIGHEVTAPALDVLRRIEATTPGLSFRLHRGSRRRRGVSRHRQVDVGEDDQAVRGGRRHPPRRLRPAERALSRQHRDHAAGRTALHLRSLCRRAAGAADPRRPLPDRRRARTRHRLRADPQVDRRPVRVDGQRRHHARRGARDVGRHAQQDRAAVRLLAAPCGAAQVARQTGQIVVGRQGQRLQGVQLAARHLQRAQGEIRRASRPRWSMSTPARR